MCAHWKSFFDANGANANFLFSYDLLGKEHHLLIKKVTQGELTGDKGRKTRKAVLTFEGAKKQLALNVTNCKTIATLYGTDTREWAGKAITIFPTMTDFGGTPVECIRIRTKAPKVGKSGEALNDVPPPNPADVMSDDERAEIERIDRSERE